MRKDLKEGTRAYNKYFKYCMKNKVPATPLGFHAFLEEKQLKEKV